jgi:hypothetical protein
LGDDALIAVFNVGTKGQGAHIPVTGFLSDDAVLKDVWSGRAYPVGTGEFTVHLGPRSALVLEVIGS